MARCRSRRVWKLCYWRLSFFWVKKEREIAYNRALFLQCVKSDIDISIGCAPPTPRFTLRAVASTLREANICDDYTLIAKAKASLFSINKERKGTTDVFVVGTCIKV